MIQLDTLLGRNVFGGSSRVGEERYKGIKNTTRG